MAKESLNLFEFLMANDTNYVPSVDDRNLQMSTREPGQIHAKSIKPQ